MRAFVDTGPLYSAFVLPWAAFGSLVILYFEAAGRSSYSGSLVAGWALLSGDLTVVWAEAWAASAGQDKTPGGIWAGTLCTAVLSWDTAQEGSRTPGSAGAEEAACSPVVEGGLV